MKILNYGSLNIDYTYSVDHFVRGGETMSSEEMHVLSLIHISEPTRP